MELHCRLFADGAIGHRIDPFYVDPLSYFSHDWCTKGRGMYCPVDLIGAYKRPLTANQKE